MCLACSPEARRSETRVAPFRAASTASGTSPCASRRQRITEPIECSLPSVRQRRPSTKCWLYSSATCLRCRRFLRRDGIISKIFGSWPHPVGEYQTSRSKLAEFSQAHSMWSTSMTWIEKTPVLVLPSITRHLSDSNTHAGPRILAY